MTRYSKLQSMQVELTEFYGTDVVDWLTAEKNRLGLTYKQMSDTIYQDTGWRVPDTTLQTWVSQRKATR